MIKKPSLVLCVMVMSGILISGCSRNYMAEREFYKAEKIFKGISEDEVKTTGPSAFDPAIEAFEKVANKYPTTPKALESLFTISNLCVKQEKYAEAREALRKVVINFSGNSSKVAEARFQMARIFEKENQWGQAESVLWETAEYHPTEARGLESPIYVIRHYLQMKYPDAARRAYEQAVEYYEKVIERLGPIEGSIPVRNYMAVAHSTMGDWKAAREEWLSTWNDFQGKPGAFLSLIAAAEASQMNGQETLALSLYNRFIDRSTEDFFMKGQVYVRVGLIYHHKGAFGEARKHYEASLKYFKDSKAQTSDVKLLIARTHQSEGNWDAARSIYDEIESDNPRTAAALQVPLMKANYFESQGDAEQARKIRDETVKQYQEIALRNPNTPVEKLVMRLIHDVNYQQTDWQSTLQQLDKAMSDASTTEKKGELLLMKALIADKQLKDKALALNLYNDFLSSYSDHTLVQTAKHYRDLLAKS